jgi:UDP-N-acetylglucosamine 2-epimerase
MTKSNTIIVDIDNILWAFHDTLCCKQKEKYGKDFYDYVDTVRWDDWKLFLTESQFYSICNEIHLEQHIYKPFSEAENFLKSLKEMGFYIILATHRSEDSKRATKLFLQLNNLAYDELHLTPHTKASLFNRAKFIVDDSPSTLEEAKKAGLVCTSIRYSWCEGVENIPFFNSLNNILDYITSIKRMEEGVYE